MKGIRSVYSLLWTLTQILCDTRKNSKVVRYSLDTSYNDLVDREGIVNPF